MMSWIDKADLTGRTAVVTGGLGTIGLETCRALAAGGARVVILDIDEDRWQDLQASFAAAGHDVTWERCDTAQIDDIPEIVADLDRRYDGIEIWVNAAYPRTEGWGQGSANVGPVDWRSNVDWHLNAYCLFSQEIAACMARRGGGAIVNIASIFGVVSPDYEIYEGLDMTTPGAYCAIKGGIIAFSRFLAGYWGSSGIRVNTVCPGGVRDGQPENFVERYENRTPLGRMATAAEIGAPVAFLASDAASYITGATLMVDGGWTAL